MTAPAEIKWLQELQSFLNGLLEPILPDDGTRFEYLTAKHMAVWATAFTHETYSPSDNYEDLEYLGDAVLKSLFPKYLMRRLPHLHKNNYTELNINYMSKMEQARLARKLGLSPFVRVKGMERTILNLETDAFESFFGALDTVSDDIQEGLGLANCYNMIIHIFSTEIIDEKRGEGAPKTQIIQIFTRFGLAKPEETIQDVDAYNTRVSVSLPNANIEFLRSYGVNIRKPVIGEGVGATQKEADANAYVDALKTLNNLGVTTKWAEQTKHERDFSDPRIARFTDAANKRLQQENFISMYFFIPRKTVTKRGAIVQLVGVRENGKSEVLAHTYTTDSSEYYIAAKTQVIRQYATVKAT